MSKDVLSFLGRKFGRLVVKSQLASVNRKTWWLCVCDCGREVPVRRSSLVTGNTSSCGCLRAPGLHIVKSKDLRGRVFGRLTVIDRAPSRGDGLVHWYCLCVCGGSTSTPRTGELLRGRVVSCGCYRTEVSSVRAKTHGKSKTRLYAVWAGMKSRCLNENNIGYANYGGRGIDIDPRWINSFETFIADIGQPPTEKMTLERVNNSRGYWPDNIIWADSHQQTRNRRNNVYLTYDGRTQIVSDWLKELHVSSEVYYRYIAKHGRDGVISALLTRCRKPAKPKT